MLFQFGQHAAHKQGASRSMSFEIVGNHDGYSSSLLRTSDSSAYLLAKDVSGTSGSNSAIKPAIPPIQQAKTVHLPILSRSLDQALATSSFSRPDARQNWVK